jgi:hypothetical protein
VNRVLDWVLARAQERSTWLGVTALLSSLGVAISPELQSVIVQAGLAVSGLVLVMSKDRKDRGAKGHAVSAKPSMQE